MPIYEYECTCCPTRFELKRSFSDETPAPCPECGGDTTRIFSAVPIIFKGSGFYVTDNRDNNNRSSSDSSTSETKTGSTESS